MSEAREHILALIRRNLQRNSGGVAPSPTAPIRHPVPARARLEREQRIELFVRMAEEASASVQRVAGIEQAPGAVADFILRQNLPSDIVMAPDGELAGLPWQAQPRLRIQRRAAQNGDRVSVTGAFAGIAETGTLMLLSGPHSPTTLNFLPDVHIVVLSAARIVGPYEDAWAMLRGREAPSVPRTVNFITGPSRSADIEQTLQLGAHGPVRLHIVIADSADAASP